MTQRKSKIKESDAAEIQNKELPMAKAELTTIKLPPSFPFEDLKCTKEHMELFNELFGRT